MKLLFEKGYVYEEGKHLYLTLNGKAYAETVYEKHCTIKDYLISIGVSPSTAEEDACKMEHVLSTESFEATLPCIYIPPILDFSIHYIHPTAKNG